ncbi:hypothetical protein HDV05_008141 [Chytridiales sp. JEL 0842]|nr:hypothetical protein HDV05_008141 [Chytridiales sp. JEL 0842]
MMSTTTTTPLHLLPLPWSSSTLTSLILLLSQSTQKPYPLLGLLQTYWGAHFGPDSLPSNKPASANLYIVSPQSLKSGERVLEDAVRTGLREEGEVEGVGVLEMEAEDGEFGVQFWMARGLDEGGEERVARVLKGLMAECVGMDKVGDERGTPISFGAMDERYLKCFDLFAGSTSESLYKITWKTPKPYLVVLNDGDFETPLEFGDVFTAKDGKEYVFDRLKESDIPLILEHSTVRYQVSYLQSILTNPPTSHLAIAIRPAPSSPSANKSDQEEEEKPSMVTWILTHDNLALGLLSTLPTHRRLGFAQKAAAQLLSMQRQYRSQLSEDGLGAGYCFIDPGNTGSLKVFVDGLKSRVDPGLRCVWLGGWVNRDLL